MDLRQPELATSQLRQRSGGHGRLSDGAHRESIYINR